MLNGIELKWTEELNSSNDDLYHRYFTPIYYYYYNMDTNGNHMPYTIEISENQSVTFGHWNIQLLQSIRGRYKQMQMQMEMEMQM